MNGGSIIVDGMVYVLYGAQNNPLGGVISYALNCAPFANSGFVVVDRSAVIIDAFANDGDPDGDALQFVKVAGRTINPDDGLVDIVQLANGSVEVFNRGDDFANPDAAYLRFTPNHYFGQRRRFSYKIAAVARPRVVNGVALDELEPTHRPRRAGAKVRLVHYRH
jgi:hypothetical protein